MPEKKPFKRNKDLEPHSQERFGIQRKIVANMTTESWQAIPHTAVIYEPDVTDFWDTWQILKSKPEWAGISVNTVLLYICAMGLLAAPEMNAHLSYMHSLVSGDIKRFKDINVSMPTALPDGSMMTLNVRNCEGRTLRELGETVADLRRRLANTSIDDVLFEAGLDNTVKLLKRGKLPTIAGRLLGTKIGSGPINRLKGSEKRAYKALPATERLTKHDIEQGTVVISNIGSIYRGSYNAATLIEIIPPMVCALCIGGFTDKPGLVTREGRQVVEPRKFLPININMDHRALDYDGVVPFCKRLDGIFADPGQMAGWLDKAPV